MDEKTLILELKYGGLGDHLFYSHIPKIAKQTGKYNKVYISNFSNFRNVFYKDFIWKTNPYVDGFVDAPGISTKPIPESEDKNLLDMVMLGLGLDDGKRFHEPELYVKVAKRPDLFDVSIYDPNYISNAGRFDVRDLKKVIEKNNIQIDAQMSPMNNSLILPNISKTIKSKDLMDFCSIIVSCKDLYCLTTGTATLAAALGKPATIFYGTCVKRVAHHSKLHKYIFVPESLPSKIARLFKKVVAKIKKL